MYKHINNDDNSNSNSSVNSMVCHKGTCHNNRDARSNICFSIHNSYIHDLLHMLHNNMSYWRWNQPTQLSPVQHRWVCLYEHHHLLVRHHHHHDDLLLVRHMLIQVHYLHPIHIVACMHAYMQST
jgi:hypothetical protein